MQRELPLRTQQPGQARCGCEFARNVFEAGAASKLWPYGLHWFQRLLSLIYSGKIFVCWMTSGPVSFLVDSLLWDSITMGPLLFCLALSRGSLAFAVHWKI